MAKVKEEEEEEPLPSYLFKVKTKQDRLVPTFSQQGLAVRGGAKWTVTQGVSENAGVSEGRKV